MAVRPDTTPVRTVSIKPSPSRSGWALAPSPASSPTVTSSSTCRCSSRRCRGASTRPWRSGCRRSRCAGPTSRGWSAARTASLPSSSPRRDSGTCCSVRTPTAWPPRAGESLDLLFISSQLALFPRTTPMSTTVRWNLKYPNSS